MKTEECTFGALNKKVIHRNTLPQVYLSGVLVFYPGADVRMQREVWSKILKILCKGQKRRRMMGRFQRG